MSTDQTLQPIDADRLTLVIKVIGTICLLARYWPSVERHHTVGALAGLLCRVLPVSMTDTDVDLVLMCQEAATLAGDHEVSDRTRFVKDTYAHWSKQDPTRGGPWLVKHGHERLVELLYGLWDYQGDQRHIDELNEEYALVHLQSGSVRILSERFDGEHYFISYTKLHEFPSIFTQKVAVGAKKDGTPILKNVGSAWLEHPRRRQYKGVEMAPNPMYATPGYYNLWRGFKVEPTPGDWSLFSAHLDLVSGHDPISRAFIFNWMAETVQHPERPIGVALAFRGKQGTGKSTFAKWFGMLFGPHFLHVDSETHLTGQYNKHLQDKIVLLADEAVWAGGKAGLGVLKRMVTETTLNIEPKGIDVMTVKNLLHMMIASNEEWVVPAGWDNRRFAVFDVADTHINDKKFFRAVYEQLVDGGWAALLYDLMQHTVDTDFTEIPKTAALEEQQRQTANFEEEWWLEKLREGTIDNGAVGTVGRLKNDETSASSDDEYTHVRFYVDGDGITTLKEEDMEWPSQILRSRLHNDYIAYIEKHHRMSRGRRLSLSDLKQWILKNTLLVDSRPWRGKNPDGSIKARPYSWTVPDLDTCREDWSRRHNLLNFTDF